MDSVHPGLQPSPHVESIDAAGCERLLTAVRFGRLAVVDDGRPAVVVLNHSCDSGDVMFRTSDDSRLARLTARDRGVPAVFEVDSASPQGRQGWSVIATGVLVREGDADRCERARGRIGTWAGGDRDLVLRLDVHEVSGRRVGPPG
jgi:nitroimidazol reductase NimA-like FMN-containing flavoprotein (pyridoxamine 5'-phosphate oxidase superfamily)